MKTFRSAPYITVMIAKRTLIIAALLLACVDGFRLKIRRVESVREKLLKSGKWTEHVLRKKLSRAKSPREPQRDYDDVMYVADIGVGTPQKYFSVIMDTGSADFWIPGVKCKPEDLQCPTYCKSQFLCQTICDASCCASNSKDAHPCDNKHKFDPDRSATFKDGNKTIVLHYVSGNMKGNLAFDDVCIAGVCVENQGWIVANELDDIFARIPFDGICGLAFTEVSGTGLPPPVLRMAQNSLLERPIFTVWLSRKEVSGDMAGAITFGNYDTDHCDKSCTWVDVIGGMWMFNMDRVSIEDDQKTIGESSKDAQLIGISDTGSSLIMAPMPSYLKLATYLNAYADFEVKDRMVVLPCKDIDKLPNIYFTINNKRFAVSPKNYMVQFSEKECFLAIGISPSMQHWILGTAWMRQYCHVHDMERKKLGLCEATM